MQTATSRLSLSGRALKALGEYYTTEKRVVVSQCFYSTTSAAQDGSFDAYRAMVTSRPTNSSRAGCHTCPTAVIGSYSFDRAQPLSYLEVRKGSGCGLIVEGREHLQANLYLGGHL